MGVCPGCMLMEVQTRMCPLGHLATSGVGGECAEGAEGAVCAYLRPGQGGQGEDKVEGPKGAGADGSMWP